MFSHNCISPLWNSWIILSSCFCFWSCFSLSFLSNFVSGNFLSFSSFPCYLLYTPEFLTLYCTFFFSDLLLPLLASCSFSCFLLQFPCLFLYILLSSNLFFLISCFLFLYRSYDFYLFFLFLLSLVSLLPHFQLIS